MLAIHGHLRAGLMRYTECHDILRSLGEMQRRYPAATFAAINNAIGEAIGLVQQCSGAVAASSRGGGSSDAEV